jgi:5,10-methylenetetrahydrofolate reductase
MDPWMGNLTTGAIVAGVAILFFNFYFKRALVKLEEAPTRTEVKAMVEVESLKMEQKLTSEIEKTRHALRNEITAVTLPIGVKLDGVVKSQSDMASTLGEIKGIMSMMPKRRQDMEQQT